jgi:hypothetical protein
VRGAGRSKSFSPDKGARPGYNRPTFVQQGQGPCLAACAASRHLMRAISPRVIWCGPSHHLAFEILWQASEHSGLAATAGVLGVKRRPQTWQRRVSGLRIDSAMASAAPVSMAWRRPVAKLISFSSADRRVLVAWERRFRTVRAVFLMAAHAATFHGGVAADSSSEATS